jgi:signal transduction histidine kinase/DNA-binding response OmpR family regulator
MLGTTAKILYFILGLGIAASVFILLGMKRKRDRARQQVTLKNKKEKEIYTAKINFFTNITHEIRTPLTLIKMPIDKILSSGTYDQSNEKNLRIIQANTDRLLNLTNQLLDMRKMENNEISLSFVKEDICSIVRKALRLFEQMAADQHITMNSEIPDSPIYIMCAKESVLSIVSNLISNAVKYGNGQINVRLMQSEDQQSVVIRVDSNGEIITGQDRENIFKLFFQREGAEKGVHGTGLGLPYARTMANMHNGRLYLDETVTDMNSFVLELPVKQAEVITFEHPSVETDAELPAFDSSRHSILIAEDSPEMRGYLAKELSAEYNVFTAANGADALELAKKEKIDLVISDVMITIMDGCELCNMIKSDSDLSHVPVILLTAAVGVETRIETLESGADGYIEKPFPMELLMSNITNLFRNKEISYKQFISKPLTHYNSVTVSKIDQEYMDKIHDYIMKHISEPDLNIENLTTQIGTSKSSLYRKLKANTGLSINEYIRVCRLKQAAELLSSQKYKINEVAFMTGFSSPSYFATCFLKQFNITPSEFVKNLGQ